MCFPQSRSAPESKKSQKYCKKLPIVTKLANATLTYNIRKYSFGLETSEIRENALPEALSGPDRDRAARGLPDRQIRLGIPDIVKVL